MPKTFTVIIEQDEDGIYVAKVPSIRGCYTQGKTVEEATERISDAITLFVDNADVEPLKLVKVLQIQA